jgi:hypothetical protein
MMAISEHLLMKLHMATRISPYTTNEEIISWFIASMHISPPRHIIKTDEGQRRVALTKMFDAFIQSSLSVIREENQPEELVRAEKKPLFQGENRLFSSSFVENLRRDMVISTQLNRRNLNMAIQQRLLDSLNYITEQPPLIMEGVRRLWELAILFGVVILENFIMTQNPLPDKKGGLRTIPARKIFYSHSCLQAALCHYNR